MFQASSLSTDQINYNNPYSRVYHPLSTNSRTNASPFPPRTRTPPQLNRAQPRAQHAALFPPTPTKKDSQRGNRHTSDANFPVSTPLLAEAQQLQDHVRSARPAGNPAAGASSGPTPSRCTSSLVRTLTAIACLMTNSEGRHR